MLRKKAEISQIEKHCNFNEKIIFNKMQEQI